MLRHKAIGESHRDATLSVVKTGTLRRSSLEKDGYYESFVTIFTVKADRRAAYWDLKSFEAATPAASEALLFASIDKIAATLSID